MCKIWEDEQYLDRKKMRRSTQIGCSQVLTELIIRNFRVYLKILKIIK